DTDLKLRRVDFRFRDCKLRLRGFELRFADVEPFLRGVEIRLRDALCRKQRLGSLEIQFGPYHRSLRILELRATRLNRSDRFFQLRGVRVECRLRFTSLRPRFVYLRRVITLSQLGQHRAFLHDVAGLNMTTVYTLDRLN